MKTNNPQYKAQLALAIEGVLKASRGFELAMTKFSNIIQDGNDSIIQEQNASAIPDSDSPITIESTPSIPATNTSDADLDDEGVAWSAEFHTKTKTQVASKLVKGGKAWRLLKGVDLDALNAYKAKFTTPVADTAPVTPSVPSAPSVPNAPSVPGMPATPSVPSAPEPESAPHVPIMRECIVVIKLLIDVYGLSWDDCKEIMVEQFSAAQNGEEVTFGGLKEDQFPSVLHYFTALKTKYEHLEGVIANIGELAGESNAVTVQDGLTQIFGQFNTTTLDGVYYGDVDKAIESFEAWQKVWQDWAKG